MDTEPSSEPQSRPELTLPHKFLSKAEEANGETHPLESAPRETTNERGRRSNQAPGTRNAIFLSNLDPYLEHYLETLPSKSQTQAKKQIISERNSSRQDRDVEFLRPKDIRTAYNLGHQPANITEDPFKAATLPKEPGIISDEIVDAGIQRLKLPSLGDRVVIPRSVLLRLIEQTITLSGAALNGEDVVIERYSPTWHRFARLLRTSDLDKISALTKPNRAVTRYPKKIESEATNRNAAVTDEGSLSHSQSSGFTNSATDGKGQSSEEYGEREYVILALDSKKKRVVSTRFRRLLDGGPHITAPSSDSLLKVVNLDKC